MKIVRKTTQTADTADGALDFVLSDATVDRYGDTISADGWDLKNFLKNPIALFNHDSSFPIGRWEHLRVVDGALRGHLRMAPAGSSARIDELRALVGAKILRSVSVGFRPIESQPRSDASNGLRYIKQELVETSLVAVPANPNALATARNLGISNTVLKMIFREGKNATLAERIARAKASRKRAEAVLAKSTTTPRTKSKVPLLTMSDETKSKYARARASTARAKALLAKSTVDAMQPFEQLNRAPPESGTWQGERVGLMWRGEFIPTSAWSSKWRDGK